MKRKVLFSCLLIAVVVLVSIVSGCIGSKKTTDDTTPTGSPTREEFNALNDIVKGWANNPPWALAGSLPSLDGYATLDDLPETDAFLSQDDLDNFISNLTADQIAALKTKLGLSGDSPTGETTRWTFTSLFLDGGTITIGASVLTDVTSAPYRDVGRRTDTEGLSWDYHSNPSRIEDSDLYEITLILYNGCGDANQNGVLDSGETLQSVTLKDVWLEFTLTPAEYCSINQDTTYLDSDDSPYLGWDADFTMKTRDSVETCRRIVFTSDDYTVTIPATTVVGTAITSVTLKLVLELNY